MLLNVLIPVKSFFHAKSRLSKLLDDAKRQDLVIMMLTNVLSSLQNIAEIEKITLVTKDKKIQEFATTQHVDVFTPQEESHNDALSEAAMQQESSMPLLTISADLPLVTSQDIQDMITFCSDHSIVLAPAKDAGTNAIIMSKPLLIPYMFGQNSFQKYNEFAISHGLSVCSNTNPALAFDLDTEEDLKTFHNMRKS